MKKATEFRVGNCIYRNGKLDTISGYDLWHTELLNDSRHLVEWDAITQIPLTEEWLLKFGFENDAYGYFIKIFQSEKNNWEYGELDLVANGEEPEHYSPSILQSFAPKSGEEVSKESVYLYHDLHFVHQLQNLYFLLTQKELQITE